MTLPFREHTPKRSNITKKVNSHRDHKPKLRIDFVRRCGYCNCHDSWKRNYYEVDHFIPENILTIKDITDYSNLVYACRSCNRSKWHKWPTGDENIPNKNNEGFVDPCEDEYNTHFVRDEKGNIKPRSKLGKWMFRELQLGKPQHAIIWNLEQLHPLIKEIEKKISRDSDKLTPDLKDKIINTYHRYNTYIEQWKEL